MCQWGDTVPVEVTVPADLSHTGERRRKTASIDRCIAPLVKGLNDAGMPTRASCCGHGKRPGNIILADGREIVLCPDFESARLVDEFLNRTAFEPINPRPKPQMPYMTTKIDPEGIGGAPATKQRQFEALVAVDVLDWPEDQVMVDTGDWLVIDVPPYLTSESSSAAVRGWLMDWGKLSIDLTKDEDGPSAIALFSPHDSGLKPAKVKAKNMRSALCRVALMAVDSDYEIDFSQLGKMAA